MINRGKLKPQPEGGSGKSVIIYSSEGGEYGNAPVGDLVERGQYDLEDVGGERRALPLIDAQRDLRP